jgi:hypothetical protein
MKRPVSEELRELLRRQELRGKTVGAVKPHLMGWANDLLDEGIDLDHSPSGGEELRPKMKPRLRIVRAMPFLAVIDGGKSSH